MDQHMHLEQTDSINEVTYSRKIGREKKNGFMRKQQPASPPKSGRFFLALALAVGFREVSWPAAKAAFEEPENFQARENLGWDGTGEIRVSRFVVTLQKVCVFVGGLHLEKCSFLFSLFLSFFFFFSQVRGFHLEVVDFEGDPQTCHGQYLMFLRVRVFFWGWN